jgi:hypothetical protein
MGRCTCRRRHRRRRDRHVCNTRRQSSPCTFQRAGFSENMKMDYCLVKLLISSFISMVAISLVAIMLQLYKYS